MNAPEVTLQSVTGVDVRLKIAGAGSRSFAFVIDWHIRLVLALAWFFGGSFLYYGTMTFADVMPSAAYAFLVPIPAAAIYLLYHPVLEIAMHGRTPGKRIAGVRLVTREGDVPSFGALLVRDIFRLIDSLPAAYLVGLVSVIFTSQHVRIGDLAGGTLLVLDDTHKDTAFDAFGNAQENGLTPQAAELVHELLERWKGLEEDTRRRLACSLIARLDGTVTEGTLMEESTPDLHARLQRMLVVRDP